MKKYAVPETISEEIFNLECVIAARKSKKGIFYTIDPHSLEEPRIWVCAEAGDMLVHLDNGKWKVEKKGGDE